VERDYRFFVGEWGHLLDLFTHINGDYPGEIDRCFWGALGPRNFLHKGQSRYKSFMFLSSDDELHGEAPVRYYDGINETGTRLVVLKLENL
jgi:hypothetical protein